MTIEEERGSIDVLLSTPQSRLRLLLEKIAALIVALIVIGLLIGLLAVAGQREDRYRCCRSGTSSLNMSLLALFTLCLALFECTLSSCLSCEANPGYGQAPPWIGLHFAVLSDTSETSDTSDTSETLETSVTTVTTVATQSLISQSIITCPICPSSQQH